MIDDKDNPYPDGRHDHGYDKPADWLPPGWKPDPEPEAEPPYEERLIITIEEVRKAWGEMKAGTERMDTIRLKVLSIIHDNECLKRERDLLVNIIKIELDCKGVKFERNGTVTLEDQECD